MWKLELSLLFQLPFARDEDNNEEERHDKEFVINYSILK